MLWLNLPHCDEKLLLYHSRLEAHLPRWCRTSGSNGALKALWLPLDKITYRTSAATSAEYINQTYSLTRLFPSTPAHCEYKKHQQNMSFLPFLSGSKIRQMTSSMQKMLQFCDFFILYFFLKFGIWVKNYLDALQWMGAVRMRVW